MSPTDTASVSRGTPLAGPELESWLEREIQGSSSKSVQFVSRGGRLYGMDSDALVHFLPGHRVKVTEYGYTSLHYDGTYAISESGDITLELAKYDAPWPVTYIYEENDAFYLFPKSGDSRFLIGGRGGAVQTADMAPFWPFKRVLEEENKR